MFTIQLIFCMIIHMKKKLNFFYVFIIIILIVFILNGIVVGTTKNSIISIDESKKINNLDAILVLGCKVNSDGSPSMMLSNRLEKGIEVYNTIGTKLLLSGDHGQDEYDEVNAMKAYILTEDINLDDVFLDHAGFSTYDSIYRAKYIFGVKKMIIVTQRYHLFRALYIAKSLGIEAYGIEANNIPCKSINVKNEIREVLARDKDVFKMIFKPESKYLGEPINIKDSGKITFD